MDKPVNLAQYLRDAPRYPSLYDPEGRETGWLPFTRLQMRGSHLLIVDASCVPGAADGLLVDLDPGEYRVDAKVRNYGIDHLIARLRVVPPGTAASRGDKLGETWTDVGLTGVCDYQRFNSAWEKDPERAWRKIEPTIFGATWGGIAELDPEAGVVMPFVRSGFGDGQFPAFELVAGKRRVGAEVEFIRPGTRYHP